MITKLPPTASNSTTNTAVPQPTPQTSSLVLQTRVNDALDNVAFNLVSPKQLMPYPRIEKRTRQVRRRGKAAIITASPYKVELAAHCRCVGVEDNDDEAVHICPVCEDEND
ncbi:hypothetical protein WA026_018774 [Henosepilachna vigintioctopunctata]|uniref:Uncharacterized protein n=1 Tax=Henosepilachna vigintioctopunctata TaxID=420089 RepID=A0AAW1TZV4_9CUCU